MIAPLWIPPAPMGALEWIPSPRAAPPFASPRTPCVPACGWLHAWRRRSRGANTRLDSSAVRRRSEASSSFAVRSTASEAEDGSSPDIASSSSSSSSDAPSSSVPSRSASERPPSRRPEPGATAFANAFAGPRRFRSRSAAASALARAGSNTRRSASRAARSHTSLCLRYQCASIPEGRSAVIVWPCGGRRSSSATSARALRHMTRRRTEKKKRSA